MKSYMMLLTLRCVSMFDMFTIFDLHVRMLTLITGSKHKVQQSTVTKLCVYVMSFLKILRLTMLLSDFLSSQIFIFVVASKIQHCDSLRLINNLVLDQAKTDLTTD